MLLPLSFQTPGSTSRFIHFQYRDILFLAIVTQDVPAAANTLFAGISTYSRMRSILLIASYSAHSIAFWHRIHRFSFNRTHVF